jgi:hypothetical protein
MTVHASHQGIQYTIEEVRKDEWRWSFAPPAGARRSGRVRGEFQFAVTVVQRGIEVWHLMNKTERVEAA